MILLRIIRSVSSIPVEVRFSFNSFEVISFKISYMYSFFVSRGFPSRSDVFLFSSFLLHSDDPTILKEIEL